VFFKLDGVYYDAKGPIRHFSIASSPTEQDYILISTRIRDTPYKQKLASLDEGSEILAWGPKETLFCTMIIQSQLFFCQAVWELYHLEV
jgi:ferredoxin-NADP reductase